MSHSQYRSGPSNSRLTASSCATTEASRDATLNSARFRSSWVPMGQARAMFSTHCDLFRRRSMKIWTTHYANEVGSAKFAADHAAILLTLEYRSTSDRLTSMGHMHFRLPL